jgi:hypothetical protein
MGHSSQRARAYHRRALPFSPEDLALTALVRILPRSRYRLAAQNDSRFQGFAANTTRIAYRQQGATPAFLLFSGPGQDSRAAAIAAAAFAQATWRPNAIQRRVSPGVVVVHVAPATQLPPAGPVEGAAVPAAVWTVDSETGHVETRANPPGSPPAGELKRAASALMRGAHAPSLGELDTAERGVMHVRTVGVPAFFTGAVSICLILVALRYGMGGVFSLFALPVLIATGDFSAIGQAAVSVLILAGILLGFGLLFNVRNLAFRTPGFSSPVPRTRNLAWGGFAAVMVALVVLQQGVFPATFATRGVNSHDEQFQHVSATIDDDGGEVYVGVSGELMVDLSGWPSAEWPGVQFRTSNPSVLSLDASPSQSGRPVARFGAHATGAARVDATSKDGRYTYQLRVNVFSTS